MDVQREMSKVGLLGQRSAKPLALSTLGKLLRNPFYCGVFVHKGELHQGVHVPMITKKTFDDIQIALLNAAKPQDGYRKQKGVLFLNFANCGSCGYAITAERHIKRSGLHFHYYRFGAAPIKHIRSRLLSDSCNL
jgi:site-specific DNA recombinase